MRSATFIKNIVQSNRYFDIKGNNLFIQDHRKAVQYHKVPYKILQVYKTIKDHKRPQCPRVSTYTMHSGLYMVYTPISNIILLFSQSQKTFIGKLFFRNFHSLSSGICEIFDLQKVDC